MDSSIGAVILAAGSSSRMGEPKQWLRLGGRVVLARVLATVRSAGFDETVLVLGLAAERAGEAEAGAVLAANPRIQVVVNARYREGMATSLQAGLGALPTDAEAALIVLADQPLVRPETLRRIVEEYRRSRAKIVIPVHQGVRGNPVLIARSLFPELMALTGDSGARDLFARYQAEIVRLPVEDAGILMDLDTRENFEELERWERASSQERGEIEAAVLQRRVRQADQ